MDWTGQTIIIGAVALVAVWYFENKIDVPAPAPAPVEAPTPVEAAPKRVQSASVVYVPRQRGQFFVQGRVNRGSVNFLIDTGASTVALTIEDARKSGLKPEGLTYNIPVNTANGVTYAARANLDEVRVGGIRLRDIEALVVKDGLHISLLGMTFLGELQKVEATPQQLMLRL